MACTGRSHLLGSHTVSSSRSGQRSWRTRLPLLLVWLVACESEPTLEPGILTELSAPGPLAASLGLALDEEAALVLTCQATRDLEEVHRVESPSSTSHHFELWGLLADTEYTCTVAKQAGTLLEGVSLVLHTAVLPDFLPAPKISVPAQLASDVGYVLFNHSILHDKFFWEDQALIILDPQGRIRWYLQGVGGGDIDALLVPGEGILFGGASPPLQTAPTVITLGGETQFVATSFRASAYEDPGSYHHDSGLTQDGTRILTLAYEAYEDWRAFVVKEIDRSSNTVTWYWSAIEDGYMEGLLSPGSAASSDPYHANAVFDREEPQGRAIYVSLAHIDQIFKLDYASRSVTWVLGRNGDFTLLEPDGSPAEEWRWFFGQHDVQRIGNQLSVYDNGVDRAYWGQTPFSRVLVLTLDEVAMTATIRFEYTEPGWQEPYWGGYDRAADGSGLITRAHCNTCTASLSSPSALIRLDPLGTVVWRADFPDLASALYRAERLDPCQVFTTRRYCAEP